MMVALCKLAYMVMLQVCGVGSNEWNAPIAPIGVLGNHKLKEPPRAVPMGLGIDPRDLVPTPLPHRQVVNRSTIPSPTLAPEGCRCAHIVCLRQGWGLAPAAMRATPQDLIWVRAGPQAETDRPLSAPSSSRVSRPIPPLEPQATQAPA